MLPVLVEDLLQGATERIVAFDSDRCTVPALRNLDIERGADV
jgi:hypothetical protein